MSERESLFDSPDRGPNGDACESCRGKGEVWAGAPWARWFTCEACGGSGRKRIEVGPVERGPEGEFYLEIRRV